VEIRFRFLCGEFLIEIHHENGKEERKGMCSRYVFCISMARLCELISHFSSTLKCKQVVAYRDTSSCEAFFLI